MSLTTSVTGALFSTISPTLAMTSSRPAVILRSCEDRRDEVVDEREDDQERRPASVTAPGLRWRRRASAPPSSRRR